MVGRRGRIAVVLAPLLALLLLLVTRQSPQAAGDETPAATGTATGSSVPGPMAAGETAAPACPGTAALTGLCGQVAGFSGFYGSWKTAGAAGAFCLEHAKQEPLASLAYTKYATGVGHVSMSAEDRERIGYLLGRDAATTDGTKAAALAILVHAAEGDSLTTDQLTTYPTSLAPSVRSAVGDLWAEAAADHGPYTAAVAFTGHGAGAQATVTVSSAAGKPMTGFPVSWAGSSHGDEVDTTDASGQATLTIGTVDPGLTVAAHATVTGLPATDLGVWVPQDSSVQSVAVALPPVSVAATASWMAAPATATLTVVKTTSDPAYVSPQGATFTISDATGRHQGMLLTDASGHTGIAGGLIAADGPFTLSEQSPCDACQRVPDQKITLSPGQAAVVSVEDPVVPVILNLAKVGLQGQPLAGAVLHLRRASQPGGAFDVDLGVCTSTATGGCQVGDSPALPPADYQVTEDLPAPGTTWAVPRVQSAQLRRGSTTMTFSDAALVTVGFHKTVDPSAGAVDAAHETLTGAVFAVNGPALPTAAGADPSAVELGRCTTGADGTCLIPGDPLVEGNAYSWTEVTAPPGFALDPAVHTFTACAAPCDGATVTAIDQGRYAHVTLFKHVSGDATTAVSAATVDLCATGLPDALAATYEAPAGSACDPAATAVASGVTDAHGGIDFGLLPPGVHYCAVERVAPSGYQLNPVPVCGDLAVAAAVTDPAPQPLALDLADAVTPPAPTAVPTVPAGPAVPSPAPRPPKVQVLAVVKPHPHPSPSTPPPVAPPVVAPAAPSAPLAFTGAEHVVNASELGAGLLLLGLALVVGAAGPARRRRGRAWS